MHSSDKFLSTPFAILLGSFLISISILISGGFIKFDKLTGTKTAATPTPSAVSQAAPNAVPQQKTQADIVNGLKEIAKNLNLDEGKFAACIDSGDKSTLVQADLNAGTKVGVQGTPSTFINGYQISGAQPYVVFKDTIDFLSAGGDFSAPTAQVKYLVDGNLNNGEVEKNRVNVDPGNLPVLGNDKAPVTIVEFSDYQCPFCEQFFNTIEPQLKKEYLDTGKASFYYRDFPLSQIHPGAEKGAEAARCAGDQNKYWEFHSEVFANQSRIF